MADVYRSFRELAVVEREGTEWTLEYHDRGSRVLVMAPHGGWIEPLTTELARAVAGPDLSFYSFLGIKDRGNESLHITSHRFDEPVALEAAERADRVLALHGERTRGRAFVMVGGRDEEMRQALQESLRRQDIPVRPPRRGLDGRHRWNICNRGRRGAGAQLEISEGLRAALRADGGRLRDFVRAVRDVALAVEKDLEGDPGGGVP